MKVIHWLSHVAIFSFCLYGFSKLKNHHCKNDDQGRSSHSQNSFWTVSRNRMNFRQIPCLNPSSCHILGIAKFMYSEKLQRGYQKQNKAMWTLAWPSAHFTSPMNSEVHSSSLPASPAQLVEIRVHSGKHCRQLRDRKETWKETLHLWSWDSCSVIFCALLNINKNLTLSFLRDKRRKTDLLVLDK